MKYIVTRNEINFLQSTEVEASSRKEAEMKFNELYEQGNIPVIENELVTASIEVYI